MPQMIVRPIGIRPKLKIPYQKFDYILELIALIGLITLIVTFLTTYSQVPQQIPTHFTLAGDADAWGGKLVLIMYPILAGIFYVAFSLLERFPHKFNYFVTITERNVTLQYILARRTMSLIKSVLVWMFYCIYTGTTQVASTLVKGNLGTIMVIFVITLVIIFFGFMMMSLKNK